MRHDFAYPSAKTCTCHGLNRMEVLAEVTQHEPLPLVGLGEIAMRAGVQKPVVALWRDKAIGFPAPVGKVATSPVWWWPDVMSWLEATGRRTDAGWTKDQITGPGQKQERERFFKAGLASRQGQS